jgi:hypothetical protein
MRERLNLIGANLQACRANSGAGNNYRLPVAGATRSNN